MKLYRVSIGHTELFAAGVDAEDIYNRRESLDHTFAYLPIVIDEVKVEGYEIIVNRTSIYPAGTVIDIPSTRDSMKAWLEERSIPYVAQWGNEKLSALIREKALTVA